MFVKFHLSSNPKAKEEENHFTAFQKKIFMLHSGGFGTCNSQLMKKITDGSTAIAFFFLYAHAKGLLIYLCATQEGA